MGPSKRVAGISGLKISEIPAPELPKVDLAAVGLNPKELSRVRRTVMYIGPETLMPLASAAAAVVGVLLMFWRKTVAIVRMGFQKVARIFGR